MRIKFLTICVLAIGLCLVCNFLVEDEIYGYTGEGGNTSGVSTNCNAPNAYTELCGNPSGSKGGGASWRIFSTKNPQGLENNDNGHKYSANILTDTKGVFAEIKNNCGAFDWFVSFGWDGMQRDDTYQIGPAKYDMGLIGSADYNYYNSMRFSEIKSLLKDGKLQNNTKVRAGTAHYLYQLIYGPTADIPRGTGFFCLDPTKIIGKEYTLTAIAIDEAGHMLDKNGNGLTDDFSRAELAVRSCPEKKDCSVSVKRELSLKDNNGRILSGGATFKNFQSQTIKNPSTINVDRWGKGGGVLDIDNGRTDNLTEVWLYPEWSDTSDNQSNLVAQEWQVIKSKSDDYYRIVNDKAGRLIDVKDGTKGKKDDVWVYNNNGTEAQRWLLDDDLSNIINKGSETLIRPVLAPEKALTTDKKRNNNECPGDSYMDISDERCKSGKDRGNIFLEKIRAGDSAQLWTISNNNKGGKTTYKRPGGAMTGDGYIFAVYKTPSYTFTVNFKDTNGKTIGLPPLKDENIKFASTITYTSKDSITNYVFRGWKTKGVCAGRLKNADEYLDRLIPVCEDGTENKGYYLTNNKKTYNYMNVTNDVSVDAIYELIGFKGQTSVFGGATGTTGFTSVDDPKSISKSVFTKNHCSSGCKVRFEHELKRSINNLGSTKYTVSRTSNLTKGSRGIANNPKVATGDIKEGQSFKNPVYKSDELTLYPGMVVCERLTFKPNRLLGTKDIYTEVCVKATGDAQGGNDGNTVLLDMKVKNNADNAAEKYKGYQETVYAKPGDTVTYRANYNPMLQYTYFLAPEKRQIDGGKIFPPGNVNNRLLKQPLLMYNLFNNNKGNGLKNWNNDFTVSSTNLSTSYTKDHSFDGGDTTQRNLTNDYKIQMNDVGGGKELTETAQTNKNESTRTTPSQVSFRNINNFDTGNVITKSVMSSAKVRVPYNFINETEITSDVNKTTLYAGESTTLKFNVYVRPKTNSVTTNDSSFKYATKVDNGKYKINFCIGGSFREGCPRSVEYDQPISLGSQLNISDMKTGGTFSREAPVNIPDEPAGTLLCARSMVYPANSGSDDNYSDREGSHTWAYSEEKCYRIAKKPSIQVWGGNIYTRGDITTLTSNKNNLAGYAPYKVSGNTDYNRSFGSWGELGIIADGKVVGLASGAGLGYSSNSGGNLRANPGGNTSNKYCDHSPLSFANANCGSGIVGFIGSKVAQGVVEKETDSIMSKFGPKSGDKEQYKVSGSITLENDNPERINDRNIYYYDGGSNNISISESTVNANRIQVVRSDKDITIEGNLKYADVAYNLLAKDSKVSGAIVPKLVIMAKNININCGVNQVDALLVAEETVDTCSNSDNIKNRENSNQLKINGAIVAKKLIANRTYGASTGANSIIPAEIINFDQSLLLWGALGNSDSSGDGSGGASDTDGSGGRNYLDVTYTRELAPRF